MMSKQHLSAGAKGNLLLAACAVNSYPLLFDLTDGATHHVVQLTGTSLICWTHLMPQQAYYKQAE